jgi:hypothetical protein
MGVRLTPLERAIRQQTDRRAKFDEKQKALGLVRVSVWVPVDDVKSIKAGAATLVQLYREELAERTPF